MAVKAKSPMIHVARSRATLRSGEQVQYAYVRYSVYDPKKGRLQPKALAGLGRVDKLDEGRLGTLEGFLKDWLRKDSSLPFEALEERFRAAEPELRILCSRGFGLRWLVEQAWEELGYKEALAKLAAGREHHVAVDVAIFGMVLAQLICPQSKRAMARWNGAEVFFPEGEGLTSDHLYQAMDVLVEGYDSVEASLSEVLRELSVEVRRLLHDTTSIEFRIRYDDEERAKISQERRARGEAKTVAVINEPPLRLRGHSKSKRPDLPQVVLNVVTTEHGLVVHHSTHAGNTSDRSVTAEAVRRLECLGYREVEWAGDAGTNSVANREVLRGARFDFVLGEGVARTKVSREVLSAKGRYRQHPERPELSYKCVVAEASDERRGKKSPGRERLYVVRRNRKEEQHAKRRIEKHLEKVEEELANGSAKAKEALLHHRTYKRYVKPSGRHKKDARPEGAVVLDRERIATLRQRAGKSVIGTDQLEADPIAVDEVYRNLFDVERIFRQLKSTIEIGPIRHRRADRILAHVMLAVMARNLAAWLELRSGMTFESLRQLFANVNVQQVELGSETYWQCVELEPAQKKAIQQIGYTLPPTRFIVSTESLASNL